MGAEMKKVFYANASKGIVKLENENWFKKSASELSDGRYTLTIEKAFSKRSLQQSAYYWSIVVPMVKDGLRDAGYNEVKTNDDAHLIMKHLFLKKKFYSGKLDTEIVIDGSTAKLTTVEFNAYLEEIWQWASAYLSITIPAPNEQTSIMFAVRDNENNLTLATNG